MMKRQPALFLSISLIITVMISFVPRGVSAGSILDSGKVRLDLGAGVGSYNMSKINDEYIDWASGTIGIFDDEIERGPGFSGSIGYLISPRVSIDFGMTFLRGISDKDDRLELEDIYGDPFYMDFKSELRTTLLATEVKARYFIPVDPVDIFVGGGIAWCYGKASLDLDYADEDSEAYTYTSHGLGLEASLGGYVEIYSPVSLFCEAGYRYYKTGNLKDSDGKKWKLDALDGEPVMDLDFSGFFFAGGISIAIPR